MKLEEIYDVVEVPEDWKFELLGHGERTCIYPEWVVPVGKLQNRDAMLWGPEEGVVRADYLHNLIGLINYDEKTLQGLSGFDYRKHLLFAFSNEEVVYHTEEETGGFVRDLLEGERLKEKSVFVRNALAHASFDADVITQEVKNCVEYLKQKEDGFLKRWFRGEMDLIRRPKKMLGLGIPELAEELEKTIVLE